ncbi:hypothetical protein HYY70_04090 [Candidatus Woesearchaeota archaeon]|nr:hypothetical protein [Candidatus Woesearchaeota archaeon]
MVKKFISGILGKKEEQAKATESAEEIPDELPPLAEEIVAKAAAPKKEAAETAQPATAPKEQEKQEVPEELPPIDESATKTEEAVEPGTLDDLDKEDIPEEVRKAKLAKSKIVDSKTAPEAKVEEIKMAKDMYTPKERIQAGAEVGFFSNILEYIKKHDGAKERLLAGDLFSRMGNYWELRKNEIKTGAQLPTEKKLEQELLKKLEELRILEQKWQVQRLALEEDMKYIHEREIGIQAKADELKMISNELSLFRSVKPEEYFYLHNGVVLKCLHDLIDILEVIDEESFKYHVREGRNDFSDWIRHVFRDNNLADKIKNAKTKMEMIETLETVPVITAENKSSEGIILNPKKYFWLANGTVIRNLYELSDALRVIDDEMFGKHVNESKNDFAKWVGETVKNEHLAKKLTNAKTKQEMIEIIEVFL